eukprot:SAG31_NODE_9382_length_1287_cov_1.261785_1_plen_178_part_01
MQQHFQAYFSDPFEKASEFVQTLREWKAGSGRQEQCFGSLRMQLPLHDERELQYLTVEWGQLRTLCRPRVLGFDAEKDDNDGISNTFGSSATALVEHKLPFSILYQPHEEIRDYFGDGIGIFFCWLGIYTQKLVTPSVLGTIVIIVQPFCGGVDKNPLTLAYSIFVALWSVVFLEAWE